MNGRYTTLHFDGKTKEELLENAEIQRVTEDDYYEVVRIIAHTFEIEGYGQITHQTFNLVEEELEVSRAILNESIKVVDKRDGNIYGLLVYSDFPIHAGSPILAFKETRSIGEYLSKFSQINGFAFILDKRLRGTNLDKEMIRFNSSFLEQFDYVWVATDKDSKTNLYWKRMGGINVLTTDEACFYVKNMTKNKDNDVFILKELSKVNAK